MKSKLVFAIVKGNLKRLIADGVGWSQKKDATVEDVLDNVLVA